MRQSSDGSSVTTGEGTKYQNMQMIIGPGYLTIGEEQSKH